MTIGDGAVVGAGAVVAKDVRPYAIVVGNPAVEKRRRFDDTTVANLLETAWWTWPDARIAANFHTILAPPGDGTLRPQAA